MVGRRAVDGGGLQTDRRERRRIGQLQLYGLALQRATGLPPRGIVLEV
jgi:hypothetical protein